MDKTLLEVIEDSRNIAMNALEKADQLVHPSHQWGFNWPLISESAEILRQQHEAIVKLRSALIGVQNHTEKWTTPFQLAEQALKDMEEIAK